MGDVARARIWVGLLIVTLLTLAFLGLAPTGEGTYFCDVPPVARLFQPEAEAAPAGFPDEGAPSANQPEADVPDAVARRWTPLLRNERPSNSAVGLAARSKSDGR